MNDFTFFKCLSILIVLPFIFFSCDDNMIIEDNQIDTIAPLVSEFKVNGTDQTENHIHMSINSPFSMYISVEDDFGIVKEIFGFTINHSQELTREKSTDLNLFHHRSGTVSLLDLKEWIINVPGFPYDYNNPYKAQIGDEIQYHYYYEDASGNFLNKYFTIIVEE